MRGSRYMRPNKKNHPDDNKKFLLGALPGLILLCCTFLFVNMPVTYMPVLLKDDFDIQESTTALIISASTFTYVISCLVSPKLDDMFDGNLVTVCSYFLFMITGVLFSFILYLPSSPYLIPAVAITLRAISGFAAGIYENLYCLTLIRKYADNMGTATATIEGAINVGYLTGPLLGGVVYTWTREFSTTSLVPLCPTLLVYIWYSCLALKDDGTDKSSSSNCSSSGSEPRGGFLKVLGTWQMVLLFSFPFYCSFVSAVPLTITAPHIQDAFDGDAIMTGLMFVLNTVGYTLGAVLSGLLTDKPMFRRKNIGIWLFAISPFFIAIGNFLIGPAFFIPFKPSLYFIGLGFFVDGLAFGIGSGPLIRILLAIWKGIHPDLEADYTAHITSILLVSYSLGEVYMLSVINDGIESKQDQDYSRLLQSDDESGRGPPSFSNSEDISSPRSRTQSF